MRFRLAVLLVILLAVGDAVLLVVSVCLPERENKTPCLDNSAEWRTITEQRAEISALREEVRKWRRLLDAEKRGVLDAERSHRTDILRRFRLLLKRPEWGPADPPCNAQGMLEAVHVKTGLTFVLIPAGSFQMGSPEDEEKRFASEGPVHTVNVKAFLLCRTECTQAAWERGGGKNNSEFKGTELPVEKVNWMECRDWCARNGLRLPSESEWEYACRAGTRTRFCFGDDEDSLKDYAAYDRDDRDHGTIAVGGKRPNPWGLYDMHGNVWEWCEDRWHDDYERAPTDGAAWTAEGDYVRIMRGGCWGGFASYCRSANRSADPPSRNLDYLGFRPAADLPPLEATEDIILRVLAPDGTPMTDVAIYRHHPAGWDVILGFGSATREGDAFRIRLDLGIHQDVPLSVGSRFGALAVPIPPSGAGAVMVQFQPPGTLELAVTGIHGEAWQYLLFVRATGEGPSDGYYEGTIHPEDDLPKMRFQPGEYDLKVVRDSLPGYHPLFQERITITPGVNRIPVQLPETHDLTVLPPGKEEGEWLAAWPAVGAPLCEIEADRREEDRVEYLGLPPGTYNIYLELEEEGDVMVVRVPTEGPIEFSPSRIDALRVQFSEYLSSSLPQAGFEEGDLVIEVEGQAFASWREAQALLRAAGSAPQVTVTVLRGDRRIKLIAPSYSMSMEGYRSVLMPIAR